MLVSRGLFCPMAVSLAAVITVASAANAGSVMPGFAAESADTRTPVIGPSGPLLDLGTDLLTDTGEDGFDGLAPLPLFDVPAAPRAVTRTTPGPAPLTGPDIRRD